MQSLYGINPIGISNVGLGATVAGQAAGGIAVTLGTAAALSAAICPPCAIALGLSAGLVTLFQSVFGVGNGCGNTCVQATAIANQVASLLAQNLANYVSQPIRTVSMQTAALATFDQAWASMQQGCAAITGAAGVNCIGDRQAGACKWKASPGGWVTNPDGTCTYTYWGAAGSGSSCWNWFNGMRDPIANDPCVVPDSVLSAAASDATAIGIPTSVVNTVDTGITDLMSNPMLLIAGVALVLVVGNS